MISIPAKIKERIIQGVKKYKNRLVKARDKDINESDTVAIINDILSDVFGYEKYEEITSEFAIKKTFCDLAIKINDEVKLLIEVKSAGMNLKEQHVKQSVDYGSNSGVDWCVLTNGLIWKVYKIKFSKPVEHELVYEFNLTEFNAKKESDIEQIYFLTKESISKATKKSLIDEYYDQKQIVNKYMLTQILLADTTLNSIRNTFKKISKDIKVSNEELSNILIKEIIKKDTLDDELSKAAKKKVANALKKASEKAKKVES